MSYLIWHEKERKSFKALTWKIYTYFFVDEEIANPPNIEDIEVEENPDRDENIFVVSSVLGNYTHLLYKKKQSLKGQSKVYRFIYFKIFY